MTFRASFCDPLNPEIVELGEVQADKVIEMFDAIPWSDHLQKMETAGSDNVHFSPSFEVENKTNRNGLSVSAIDGREWYIFFKRPKRVKTFFGLSEKNNENFLSDIQGQTIDDVRTCLRALIANDLDYLERKIP